MPFLIFPDTDVKLVPKNGEALNGAVVRLDFNGIVLHVTQIGNGHVSIDAYEPDPDGETMNCMGGTAQFKTSKLASVSPLAVEAATPTQQQAITSHQYLKVGDVLKCVKNTMYFTVGSEYTVTLDETNDMSLMDDDGDTQDLEFALDTELTDGHFVKLVAQTTPAIDVTGTMWVPIKTIEGLKVGNKLKCVTTKLAYFTDGDVYTVLTVDTTNVESKDDDDDTNDITYAIKQGYFHKELKADLQMPSTTSWTLIKQGEFKNLKVGDVIKCIGHGGYPQYFTEDACYAIVPSNEDSDVVCLIDNEGDKQSMEGFDDTYGQTKWVKAMDTKAKLYVAPELFVSEAQVQAGDWLEAIEQPPYAWYTKGKKYQVYDQQGVLRITGDDDDKINIHNLLSSKHKGCWVVIKGNASKSGQVCTLENTDVGDVIQCDDSWEHSDIFEGPQTVIKFEEYAWHGQIDDPKSVTGVKTGPFTHWALAEMQSGSNDWLKQFKHV